MFYYFIHSMNCKTNLFFLNFFMSAYRHSVMQTKYTEEAIYKAGIIKFSEYKSCFNH